MNFPQLQCLVGTSRSNLVNFVKINCDNALDDHYMNKEWAQYSILILLYLEWPVSTDSGVIQHMGTL